MANKSKMSGISFYQNRILEKFSQKDPKPITLRQLTMFGRTASLSLDKLLISANYVREELPVRLAHRIREFQQLPFVVGANPHIEAVYQLYWDAFERFRLVPTITTLEDNRIYCELVKGMLHTHRIVIPQIVMGIHESQKYMEAADLNKFINETLQSRVSRRVLAEQHIALSAAFDTVHPSSFPSPSSSTSKSRPRTVDNPNIIGIVNTACNAHEVVQKCAALVGDLFLQEYHLPAPKVLIDGDLSCTFTYINDHIEYIIFELLKNSMRYTYETHADAALLPPIRVTIGVGDDQIMFRVSDQGGGISKSVMPTIWNFVKLESKDISKHPEIVAKIHELVPLNVNMGIGLPMSKVYAGYWGGGLSLYSMPRYGLDTYVSIAKGNQQEHLSFIE